jgi:hypothetical protein
MSCLLTLDGRNCANEITDEDARIAGPRLALKNCRWLKPVLVGQFEFVDWTPDGHLRHCRFVAEGG